MSHSPTSTVGGEASAAPKAEVLKDLLQHDENFTKFLGYVRSGVREASSHDVVKDILTEFGGIKAFSVEYLKWLKAQTQPFLTLSVIDSSLSPPETAQQQQQHQQQQQQQQQQQLYSSKTATLIHSERLAPQVVKVKKRMTPSLVSASSGPGNIASIQNSTQPIISRESSCSSSSTPVHSASSPSVLSRSASADAEVFGSDSPGSRLSSALFRSSSVGTTSYGFSSPLPSRSVVPLEVIVALYELFI
jgi:hypothetical protein